MAIVQITPDLLIGCGAQIIHVDAHAERLNQECQSAEINTPLRVAHFIAQVFYESGNLRWTQENLNYSATGLLTVFPKYFDARLAQMYQHKPQAIASRVYANRMGNGPESSGDGWRYRGRGLIQVTGKDNYRALGRWVNRDLINNPDLVATEYAAASATWYWTRNGLNTFADQDDLRQVTRRVNGGFNGLEQRRKILEIAKYELGVN